MSSPNDIAHLVEQFRIARWDGSGYNYGHVRQLEVFCRKDKRIRPNYSAHSSLGVAATSRMSVEQTDIIDFVSTAEGGTVALSVSDHLSWADERSHLTQLQDKLNRYLDFINSGELVDKFPETADLRPVVRVYFVHAPTETAQEFLDKTAASIEAEGVGFTHTVLPRTENT
jgi:hypothetical protein